MSPSAHDQQSPSAAEKLRAIVEDPNGFILAPGVYDGLSARIALEVGFDSLYMTGAGTAASRLGQPDIGLTGLSDMREHAEMIANLDPSVPLIADMDTGFGGPANVHQSVQAYIRAGVSAFHIEDQTQQKRCGHLSNKQLVPTATFTTRIRAAVAARHAAHSPIVLIARTDALASLGYDAALARLQAARSAGADVGFLEGVVDEAMMGRVVRELAPWPVLLNMVEAGLTPTVSVRRAREIGFRVVIWPFAGLTSAIVAMREAYAGLKKTGLVPGAKMAPKEIFELCGLEEWVRIDGEAGGDDFRGGV